MSFITPRDGWENPREPPQLQILPDRQPLQGAQPTPLPPIQPAPWPSQRHDAHVTCKVCDRGWLTSQKVFRMSGPVVAIGVLLLIPSVLGILGCLVSIAASFAGSEKGHGLAAIGTLVFGFFGVICFVSGLLGWLLVMRKHVLKCNICGATINASTPSNQHFAPPTYAPSNQHFVLPTYAVQQPDAQRPKSLVIVIVLLALILLAVGIRFVNQTIHSTGPKTVSQLPKQPSYRRYSNARFGFSITYPDDFVLGREPENGDGLSFTAPDGKGIITVSGSYPVDQSTSEAFHRALAQVNGTVTYRRLTPTWFVVSWQNSDRDEIGYQKTFVGSTSESTLLFVYPASQKKQYDSVLGKISKSFQPGE